MNIPQLNPSTVRDSNRSLNCRESLIPRHRMTRKTSRIIPANRSPPSSPMMEKMKSVWASLTNRNFCRLCPSPTPKNPPEPIPRRD
ncbi:MAG: hypothetical protein A2509_08515 [Candidatus Edwardsbacteria bacterium RIFOXYD12_FULL_50_11]|uniref:Uncharacterized protein n=1 Tax=Candidatus Edwardsbacteria bacterium GWF2_54_11 TaxID=1817851 RepID=A0A1F5RFM5_9BACT|nr:MAG: hypothetical protein A2502_01885 [Candidatus Edwardsbacteria bacterium RifOxyC12_full_54_24]OGF09016.1 MAG: hypothetical protein A2273_10340 [Candidatus Edwardsbacteria bacterium RifOxyA12_full_54_48]OGF12903.1 MAG: hypothetical protein A2024_11795 [Candidatus Edwardsbacteria bacterium GWF2_54_11]OGF17438.1 MAG: hypothetical protein A2509_08515 [Candidatus Edwardsbacteria bacterium RIFOXYD12_FULL_50_11]OGJ17717.1 MAG: hypothetical protein A2349_02405 [Candidatus Edwardsbacteria bacteriu